MIVLVGGTVFTIGYYVGQTRLLVAAPRVDTRAAVPADAALFLHVDSEDPEVYRLIQFGTGGLPPILLRGILPYEISLGVRPDQESGSVQITTAISGRRFTDLLESRLDSPHLFRDVGFESTELERTDGMMLLRSTCALDSGMEAEASGEAGAPPPPLEGGHDIEFRLDNRGGRGLLALQPWLRREEDEAQGAPLARDLHAQALGVLRHIDQLALTADFAGRETIFMEVEIETPTAQDADAALLYLSLLRDQLFLAALDQNMPFTGGWQRAGLALSATFTVSRYDPLVARYLRGFFA